MKKWRSRRDSNPRYDFTSYNGLANRRLQPLGHSSVRGVRVPSGAARALLPEKSPALKPRTCLRNPPVFDPSGYPATSVVAGIISEVISGETADLPFISMAWPRVP